MIICSLIRTSVGIEVPFCSEMLELCSSGSGLRLPRDGSCCYNKQLILYHTWLKLVLVETVSTEEVRQGDECFQCCVSSFTSSRVVDAVRHVCMEADIVRVGLGVTKCVFRDEAELDTGDTIYL